MVKLNIGQYKALLAVAPTKDVRYYLNGVHIDNDVIEATNGHRVLRIKHGVTLPENTSVIMKLPKPFPRTNNIEIGIDGTVKYYSKKGVNWASANAEIIDGRYPDTKRVLPTGDPEPTPNFIINPGYLSDVTKLLGFNAARLEMYPNEVLVNFDKNTQLLIMTIQDAKK